MNRNHKKHERQLENKKLQELKKKLDNLKTKYQNAA